MVAISIAVIVLLSLVQEKESSKITPIAPKRFYERVTLEDKKAECSNKIASKEGKKRVLKYARDERQQLDQAIQIYKDWTRESRSGNPSYQDVFKYEWRYKRVSDD